MGNMLAEAMDFLETELFRTDVAGTDVTYWRTAQNNSGGGDLLFVVTAIFGLALRVTGPKAGQTQPDPVKAPRDFYVRAAEMVVDDQDIVPTAGDQIVESQSGRNDVYLVTPPPQGGLVFTYENDLRLLSAADGGPKDLSVYRIHTTYLGSYEAPTPSQTPTLTHSVGGYAARLHTLSHGVSGYAA